MKKIGFGRRINIDWDNPLVILFIIFTGVGLFTALLITILDAWDTVLILMPSIFGGAGIVFGLLALVISYFRDR